jgi:hypothetical protein
MFLEINLMLKIILLVIALLIVGVLVFASTKPDVFSIVRKLHIKATPEKIFVEINDFNRWKSWSPWENKDPALQRTFSGASSGVGTFMNIDKMVGKDFEAGLANLQKLTESTAN